MFLLAYSLSLHAGGGKLGFQRPACTDWLRFLFELNAASKIRWRLARASPLRRSAKSFLKSSPSRYCAGASVFVLTVELGSETNRLDLHSFQADFYTLKELEKFSFKKKGIGTSSGHSFHVFVAICRSLTRVLSFLSLTICERSPAKLG